jgi:hypothetical protein
MKSKVIITGSTGMVGKGVLLECLEDQDVESVLVLNRQPLGMEHEKLKEVIIKDFFDLEPFRDQLKGYNTCFFCLGISSAGLSEEQYRKITYDLTINFAEIILEENPELTFCFISGAGTDSTEKGRQMWARVKGKTENKLLEMPFEDAYMFRPGFIQPKKGVRSRTPLYNTLYIITRPLFPLFRFFPAFTTTSEKLGKAMINVAQKGYDKKILESMDINQIANK